jgi:hypothetical protein
MVYVPVNDHDTFRAVALDGSFRRYSDIIVYAKSQGRVRLCMVTGRAYKRQAAICEAAKDHFSYSTNTASSEACSEISAGICESIAAVKDKTSAPGSDIGRQRIHLVEKSVVVNATKLRARDFARRYPNTAIKKTSGN